MKLQDLVSSVIIYLNDFPVILLSFCLMMKLPFGKIVQILTKTFFQVIKNGTKIFQKFFRFLISHKDVSKSSKNSVCRYLEFPHPVRYYCFHVDCSKCEFGAAAHTTFFGKLKLFEFSMPCQLVFVELCSEYYLSIWRD